MAKIDIPATMQAWQFDAYETSEDYEKIFSALQLRTDVPTPINIQDDDVLVKVAYTNINPIDWKIATGGFHSALPITKFPFTPGLDIGGTIVKVGSKAQKQQWKVGDTVIADIGVAETTTVPPPSPGGSMGAFAQYAVVKASFCAKVPEDQLATLTGLPVSALTAYQGLFTGSNKGFAGEELGNVKEGSKVLVLAGSGGVGSMAIQLAKKLVPNCFVATTSSNVQLCKDLGADQVINYKTEDWGEVLAGEEFDLILDGVGLMEDLTDRAPKVLKKGGDFVSIINFDPTARDKCPESVRFALFMIKSTGEELQTIADMTSKGDIKMLVDSEFSFQDVPAAMKKNSLGRTVGKIMIKVAE